MTIAHLGRGHTTSALVVMEPGVDGGVVVVFTGDLLGEFTEPAIETEFRCSCVACNAGEARRNRRLWRHLRTRVMGTSLVRHLYLRQREWLLKPADRVLG
ncbi:hypothetical protein [Mycobacterium uberis]|uniref:hypothetical protein n=1 Tax=Mycobacterium uberis TaxID=2162698 RepID=UPI000E3073F7|nr:hypothetical protein [Mycobacterium uberis]